MIIKQYQVKHCPHTLLKKILLHFHKQTQTFHFLNTFHIKIQVVKIFPQIPICQPSCKLKQYRTNSCCGEKRVIILATVYINIIVIRLIYLVTGVCMIFSVMPHESCCVFGTQVFRSCEPASLRYSVGLITIFISWDYFVWNYFASCSYTFKEA